MATSAIVLVAMLVVMLITAVILLSNMPKTALGEDAPTTLATRGEYITQIIGIQRVGYVFGWAGDRVTSGGSSGGKGGGGASQATTTETGWHQIAIGPCDALHAVLEEGIPIWTGPIRRSSTPSGTSFEIAGKGNFTIYWGEIDQPVNTFLGVSSRLDIRSRWPYLCYILWKKKTLAGGGTTWPRMEYIIEGDLNGACLTQSDLWLDDGTSTGINPAHALLMLLNGKYPHGAGLSQSMIDNDTLEALGVLCQNEHLPMNMQVQRNTSFANLLTGINSDLGILMPQIQGRLAFIPIRSPTGAIPTLGDDVIVPPDLECTIDRGDDPVNRSVFTFENSAANWRQADIAFDDDAETSEINQVRSQDIPITIATHINVASAIARRRSQEASLRTGIRVSALRGARQLRSGMLFNRTGFGPMRVMTWKPDDESPVRELECAVDNYGIPDIDDTANGGVPPPSPLPAEPDIAFTFFELPVDLSPTPAICVLRIRAHSQIRGAFINVSADDMAYTTIGNQDPAASGGVLLEGLSDVTDDIVAIGPVFEASNGDVAEALDLSTDVAGWQTGKQLMVIDDEVFYLQYLELLPESDWLPNTAYVLDDVAIPTGTPTGLRYICTSPGTSNNDPIPPPGSGFGIEPIWPRNAGESIIDGTVTWTAHNYRYRPHNMIRARMGSVVAIHGATTQVYIAAKASLTILQSSLLQPGTTLYLKTQPFTSGSVLDVARVTSVSKPIFGLTSSLNYRTTETGDYRVTQLGDRRTYLD